ncbi:hypothetical protein Tco_0634829 [Tanacetum coccineum]
MICDAYTVSSKFQGVMYTFLNLINNELSSYVVGKSSASNLTSVTKTTVAITGIFKWIRRLSAHSMWSQMIVKYDKFALWEFYIGAKSEDSSMHLRPQRNQLVTDDDILYKFKEGDFHRLRSKTSDDIAVLLVQGKNCNLTRVEDLKLGVESYQKKLNLKCPDSYRSILRRRDALTPYYESKRIHLREQRHRKNKVKDVRIDELHKFSDGTLDDVRTALNDRLKGIRMEYLPQTFWSQRDKANARAMIQAIDKRLKTRRIMRSLEGLDL